MLLVVVVVVVVVEMAFVLTNFLLCAFFNPLQIWSYFYTTFNKCVPLLLLSLSLSLSLPLLVPPLLVPPLLVQFLFTCFAFCPSFSDFADHFGDNEDFSTETPLAGLGYGLPLSRLYARYFGGEIQVISLAGYGTDAILTCKNVGDAQEPVDDFESD